MVVMRLCRTGEPQDGDRHPLPRPGEGAESSCASVDGRAGGVTCLPSLYHSSLMTEPEAGSRSTTAGPSARSSTQCVPSFARSSILSTSVIQTVHIYLRPRLQDGDAARSA